MNIHKLALFYFLLGVILNMADLATNLELIGLGISVADLAVFNAIMIVPWCIKPVYGLVSDAWPICGERRRPYIIMANLLCSVGWGVIAKYELTLTQLRTLLFALSMLTCASDVMYDSLLVVEAKKEDTGHHGKKQTVCWIARAAGATIASFVAGMLLMHVSRQAMFVAQASVHLVAATAAIFYVVEGPSIRFAATVSRGFCQRARQLLQALKSPTLTRPAIFMFFFGATPSSYMAFFYFLVSELHFSTALLGTFKSIRHLAMLIGTVLFRRYFRNVQLQRFFTIMVVLSSVLGATPLVLVSHLNRDLSIPDEVFVGGDDLFLSVFTQISLLPVLVLAAKLCPTGIEGSLYATFVSVINFSGVVSEWLGGQLTSYLQITRDDFENLPVLISICTLSTLFALVFIQCLPPGNIDDIARHAKAARSDDEGDGDDEGEEMTLDAASESGDENGRPAEFSD